MVRPKKHLGQHFLVNARVSQRIAEALTGHGRYKHLVEIGAGTGALTSFLVDKGYRLTLIEFDAEAAAFLEPTLPDHVRLIREDILKLDWSSFDSSIAMIGNLPYNISSQILFRVFEHRNQIQECVFMLQKEVAERIVSPPGSRNYGILSVLLQAFYDVERLFEIPPSDFYPPPGVQSAVIRLKRNQIKALACNEPFFIRLVKAGFNQRRKKLRNALQPVIGLQPESDSQLQKRAEALSWKDFELLAQRFFRDTGAT